MGLFLRGRITTYLSVFVIALLATFATFFYAWNFSRKWPNATTFTKVIKIFAMIFAALFAAQSILTTHSLRTSSKSLSFGAWSIFGVGSIVMDMWWFALMVSRRGFDAVCGGDKLSTQNCSRKNITIAYCVFMFFYAIIRLIVMLFVFHFDVKFNEVLPVATAPAAAPATAPPVAQVSALPATVARSLGKLFGRPAKPPRGVPLVRVEHWEDRGRVSEEEDEDGVLFDSRSSFSKAEHKHARLPTRDEDAFDSRSSSEQSDLDKDLAGISIDLDPLTGLPRGVSTAPFSLEDHPLGRNGKKLKVAMIGAGFAGIIAAIRIDQRLPNVELDVFEKNYTVGGTWYENSYPGLCCDIPAHCYSLTFEPKHDWTNFYANGAQILSYLQDVAKKYKLERFIRYGHRLTHAKWNEETKQWHLSFDLINEQGEKQGEKEVVTDVVIQGLGGLSRWDWPDIKGLKEFKGKKLHSAYYPDTAEAETGRTVAVIGVGSASIQIVPALQKHAARVDNYVRGQAWIATPFASTELIKRNSDANNYTFTDEEKKRFKEDPKSYNEFRKNMERELNGVHGVTLKGSALQLGAVEAFRELMEKKLASKPHIAKSLIPNFAVGCRRLTPGPGYLEALVAPNCDFISTGIKQITETGIECVDGTHREYDTIVCATGCASS
ncbi:hypothetical protein JCM11641_000404, partial [Rhodosporidiobolus odoratus]